MIVRHDDQRTANSATIAPELGHAGTTTGDGGRAAVGCFVLCAALAPWLAPQAPAQLDLGGRLLAPGHGHWFGTDDLGRDILSRTLYGARISMEVAVSVVTLSLGIGLIAGSLAGFYGGWADTVINVYVTNAFMALPGFCLRLRLWRSSARACST